PSRLSALTLGAPTLQGCFSVATACPTGTGAKVVTDQKSRDPAWSPDGRLLAVDHAQFVFCNCVGDPAGVGGTSTHIQVMNADGTGLRNITNPGAQEAGGRVYTEVTCHDVQPTWSPDGT